MRLIARILKNIKFLPVKKTLEYRHKSYTGKTLNLKDPKEFNEKLQWMKLYFKPPILTKLACKYNVRSYVEAKIGKQYLNELYGVYDDASKIDFNALPKQFILKGVHGSGLNLIVSNKEDLNIDEAKSKMAKWLKYDQYKKIGYEWAYKDIKPLIICEKFLEQEGHSSLIDYKFYCFDGKPKFASIHMDRANGVKKVFYDVDFNKLPFTTSSIEKMNTYNVDKPENLSEMVSLAEKLADNLPFVRVDFYSIKDKIIFGEMTFYPADAKKDFKPDSYNKIIGDYLTLPKIPKGKKIITEI